MTNLKSTLFYQGARRKRTPLYGAKKVARRE